MTYKFAWGLLAIEGDCSANGMGDQPDFIPIHKEDFPLIASYLRIQNECSVLSIENWFKNIDSGKKWKYSRKYQNAMHKSHLLGNELISLGVFHHKWHKRTTWKIVELEDNYPVDLEEATFPFWVFSANICLKGEG